MATAAMVVVRHWVFVEILSRLRVMSVCFRAINACRSALQLATSTGATSTRATRTPRTWHLPRTSEFTISRRSIFLISAADVERMKNLRDASGPAHGHDQEGQDHDSDSCNGNSGVCLLP